MCGTHGDSDIIFGPATHFSFESFSTPLCHKLSVTFNFFAHVTFTCLESTFSYPHKEFLIQPLPRTKFNSHPPRAHNSADTRNPRGLTRPAQDCSRGLKWLRIGILCRLAWIASWKRISVQQSVTNIDLIFTYSFFVTQTNGLYCIFNSKSTSVFFIEAEFIISICFFQIISVLLCFAFASGL